MDRKVKKPSSRKALWVILSALVIVGIVIVLLLASDQVSTTTVKRDQLIIAQVSSQPFQSSTSFSGEIQPEKVFLLDAQESGTVGGIKVEAGASVTTGDTLLILENSDLELEVLQRESQLMEQLNNQRQTRLLINQNDLNQREQLEEIRYQIDIQKPRYLRNKKLFDKGVIAKQEYEEISKTYFYYLNRLDLFKQAYTTDSLARSIELSQIGLSERRILQNLDGVKAILDKLVITAPASGRISDFEIQQGQSIASGDRLGEIYSMTDPIITAPVDELYLDDIDIGMNGSTSLGERDFRVSVIKIFPSIEEGNFTIYLKPENSLSFEPTRGQSVRIQLFMDKNSKSLVVPRGEFFNTTGGQWIYRINGDKAERTEISLGKRNDKFYEVKDGLIAGDLVIVSSYDGFKEFEVIQLSE